jgi:hypothetical protein
VRLLVVGAGSSYSTKDIELGYLAALRAAGHQVVHYALDGRIAAAGGFLRYSYRQAKKAGSLVAKPTPADTLYLAGQGILERALRFDVDWVLLVSGMYVLPDVLILLRRAGLRTALLFTESPYDDAQQMQLAALADVCWTNERTSVPVLREACHETHYLPHAYDPAKHGRFESDAANEAPAHDVIFIGTGFAERIDTLAAVDWAGLGIDLGLYGTWELLGSRHRLRRFVRGGVVPNAEAMALGKAAKITLNLYRTSRQSQPPCPGVGRVGRVQPLRLAAGSGGNLRGGRRHAGAHVPRAEGTGDACAALVAGGGGTPGDCRAAAGVCRRAHV